jgi:hypothetical protein
MTFAPGAPGILPSATADDDTSITVPQALEYSHELAERVQREADEACALPWWFWEAAAVVFVATIAISSIYPWGFA